MPHAIIYIKITVIVLKSKYIYLHYILIIKSLCDYIYVDERLKFVQYQVEIIIKKYYLWT